LVQDLDDSKMYRFAVCYNRKIFELDTIFRLIVYLRLVQPNDKLEKNKFAKKNQKISLLLNHFQPIEYDRVYILD